MSRHLRKPNHMKSRTGGRLRKIWKFPSINKILKEYQSHQSGRCQVYAYHLESRITTRISPDAGRNYQFANCEGLPK